MQEEQRLFSGGPKGHARGGNKNSGGGKVRLKNCGHCLQTLTRFAECGAILTKF